MSRPSDLQLQDVPVGDLQNVDNRIQALWIAVDLVGACNFDYESGPVRLIHEIKKRREQVADPHAFTVIADAMIREKIYELQYLDGENDHDHRLLGKYWTCATKQTSWNKGRKK